MYRICFVCTGNICRSPTAEGVMRALVAAAGLAHRFELDSAGTSGWHAGELPDPRTIATAKRRGVALTHRARQLIAADIDRFDRLLAMDATHVRGIAPIVGNRGGDKIALLRAFDPAAPPGAEVDDPYYGGQRGFDEVYDQCVAACRGLLATVRAERGW